MGGDRMPLCLAVAPKPLRWVGGFPLLFNFCARPSAFPSVRLLPVLPPSPSPPPLLRNPPPLSLFRYLIIYFIFSSSEDSLCSARPPRPPARKRELKSRARAASCPEGARFSSGPAAQKNPGLRFNFAREGQFLACPIPPPRLPCAVRSWSGTGYPSSLIV